MNLIIYFVSIIFYLLSIEGIEVLNDIPNEEYDHFLKNLTFNHSDIVRLVSIGKTANDEIHALELSGSLDNALKPTVLLAANLQGSDILGKHILMYLASYIAKNYHANERIKGILDNTNVLIIPTIKPSILENSGRCLRNTTCSVSNSIQFFDLPPETKLFVEWVMSKPIVLTGVLNSGTPLCITHEKVERSLADFKSLHLDTFTDNLITVLRNGSVPYDGDTCPSGLFLNGFTQNYLFSNSFEVSLDLHCCTNAPLKVVKNEWNKHSNGLLSFLEVAQWGVRGVIQSEGHQPVQGAVVMIIGSSLTYNITTSHSGQFWRLLLPGNYTIKVHAPTYESFEKDINLNNKILVLDPIILKNLATHNSVQESESTVDEYGFLSKVEFKHHNYEEMKNFLTDLAAEYRKITLLYSIGKSVLGRELYVLEISRNPGMHEAGEPEVKIVANMHGNEVVGREVTLLLALYICQNYGRDQRITSLVDSTRIHLLPSMNPDGYEMAVEGDFDSLRGRNNANNFDLNRNFPDQFGIFTENRIQQPETKAVMNWFNNYHFVLSANLHGGALVANYPYDDNMQLKDKISLTPDQDTFLLLSSDYAKLHPRMHLGQPCPNTTERFVGGITNGAKWYVVTGGMQDYNYVNKSTMEITLELGCFKYPTRDQLPRFWMENKEPLLHFIEQSHIGFKGFVMSSSGKPIKGAAIKVSEIEKVVYTAESGDYWRLITPGTYAVTAVARGFRPHTKTVSVPKGIHGAILNFTLEPFKPEMDFVKENDAFVDNEVITSYSSSRKLAENLSELDSLSPNLVQFTKGAIDGFSSVKITDNVGAPSEDKLHIAVFGSIYNAEPAGRELALRLAKLLIHGYDSKDPKTTFLLKNSVIHFVPAMGDFYEVPCSSSTPSSNPFALDFVSDTVMKTPLVNNFVQFIKDEMLDIIVSIEGGGSSLRYPQTNDSVSLAVYETIRRNYESKRPFELKCGQTVVGPIENMKQLVRNIIMEKMKVDFVSAQVSCCYYNPAPYVLDIWKAYHSSLMSVLLNSVQGVRAYVNDKSGNPMRRATVTINNSPTIYTVTPNQGIFIRSLPPGTYLLKFSCTFHVGKEVTVSVEQGKFQNIKVELIPMYSLGPPPNIPDKGSGIAGYVVDSDSHPIKGVTLEFVKSNASFSHKIDGTFWVPLEPGEYFVTVSAFGFLPTSKIVKVISDIPIETMFFLERSEHVFGVPRFTFILLVASASIMVLGLVFFCHSLCKERRNRHKGFFLIPTKATLFTDDDSNEIYKTPIRSATNEYNIMPYYDKSDCEDYDTESEEELMVVNHGHIQMQ